MILKINNKKYGIKEVLIDDEDFDRINQFKWYVSYHESIKNFYVKTNMFKNGKHTIILLHRFIMNLNSELVVDHKNHNPLDNRKNNLRVCTQAENIRNSIGRRKSSSVYKGVSWDNFYKKWKSCIGINFKLKHIGYFKNEIEAARAYNKAAKKYHGEYAYLNKIED